jgi:hypothetical protein
MCLDRIFLRDKKNVKEFCDKNLKQIKYRNSWWYVGWKYCPTIDNKLSLFHNDYDFNVIHESIKVYIRCNLSYDDYYNTGFHILTNRQDARTYSFGYNVKRVLFQLPRIIGVQDNLNVVVADKIIVFDYKKEKEIFKNACYK